MLEWLSPWTHIPLRSHGPPSIPFLGTDFKCSFSLSNTSESLWRSYKEQQSWLLHLATQLVRVGSISRWGTERRISRKNSNPAASKTLLIRCEFIAAIGKVTTIFVSDAIPSDSFSDVWITGYPSDQYFKCQVDGVSRYLSISVTMFVCPNVWQCVPRSRCLQKSLFLSTNSKISKISLIFSLFSKQKIPKKSFRSENSYSLYPENGTKTELCPQKMRGN